MLCIDWEKTPHFSPLQTRDRCHTALFKSLNEEEINVKPTFRKCCYFLLFLISSFDREGRFKTTDRRSLSRICLIMFLQSFSVFNKNHPHMSKIKCLCFKRKMHCSIQQFQRQEDQNCRSCNFFCLCVCV